jgi:methyl-accepting chemotaxis protein
VASSVQSIAAVSEENSAASDEVSAATEEMSAQAHQVVSSAERLAHMAVSLDALVARFKTTGAFGQGVEPTAVEGRGFEAGPARPRRKAA